MPTIKTYSNKSSVLKRNSRYIQGGHTTINAKTLGWWEKFDDIERDVVTDIPITISSWYSGRPDLIAYDYYGNEQLEWIVLQYNNIVDTVEELVTGRTITIPSKDRVFFSILVNPVRMQQSRL